MESTDGLEKRSVSLPGGSHRYFLYVPDGLGRDAPLLLSFHGRGVPPLDHANATGWMDLADDERFIVGFPDGEGDWSLEKNSDEVAFARAVVADVADAYCVDPDRVFADGHSMGGYFAQRLACDAADVFAAVTSFAGGSPDDQDRCVLSRPISVALFHGEDDAIIPIRAGTQSRNGWVERLGCDPTPIDDPAEDGASQRYSRCDGGVEVLWRVYPGQDHYPPSEPRRSEMVDEMWRFLDRFPTGTGGK
jgi:polyhydroxybutyrate depolymerase